MPNVDLGQYQVLLVDDEPFIRQLTGMLLKQLGCPNILESGNGAEALAALDQADGHVDLILSDLNMPDMDGVEFVRHLAGRKGGPPLAFLSGAESGLLRAAEALGRAYFLEVLGALAKPVNKEALVAVLDRMAEERAPRAQRRGRILVTEDDLSRGIAGRELVFHYQPKVEVASGRVTGVEALVRWEHPAHGLLFPDTFIAMAEAGPLIGPLTEALVEIGLKQARAWQDAGWAPHLGINLSPSMLSDVTLPDRFAGAAARLGVPTEAIVFEITETGVAREELIYLEIVTRLRMKGFHLSVDDFGTGQSSLQRLEALPFGELKIDRQFVHGAAKNPAKAAILEASIGLARTLGQKSVAEGVELREDWDLLQRLGCDVAQGYFIAKPMPVDVLADWIQSWSSRENAV